jgi:PAS domain S-box-containing protein
MYRLITEHAFDVIWVFDVTRRTFTYVSPSVTRLLGYAPEEVVRNSFLSILPRTMRGWCTKRCGEW